MSGITLTTVVAASTDAEYIPDLKVAVESYRDTRTGKLSAEGEGHGEGKNNSALLSNTPRVG